MTVQQGQIINTTCHKLHNTAMTKTYALMSLRNMQHNNNLQFISTYAMIHYLHQTTLGENATSKYSHLFSDVIKTQDGIYYNMKPQLDISTCHLVFLVLLLVKLIYLLSSIMVLNTCTFPMPDCIEAHQFFVLTVNIYLPLIWH